MLRPVLLAAAGGLIALLPGCTKDPFAYVPVSGKVTYDDGSKIREAMELRFLAQSPSPETKAYPRPGAAVVNGQTGEYKSVTTYHLGDGLMPGKHKVAVLGHRGRPLPADVVPPEYADFDQTPLLLDTADKETFNLKIRKPARK